MATAKAKASAPRPSATPPKGMKQIQGGYAATWDVEKLPVLQGSISEAPKTVTLTQGKKQVERRCVEVKTADGDRYTVWESAGLASLFSAVEEQTPCKVWISFRGYGVAKKGQNPPKLFDSAIG